MTKQQQATKAELENMLEKFKDTDYADPIQITFTLFMSKINFPIAMANADKVRAEYKANN